MKKVFLLLVFLTMASSVFAVGAESDDDFDSIFDDAQDITAEENDKIHGVQEESGKINFPMNIKFYGHLDTELGVAYNRRFCDLSYIKTEENELTGETFYSVDYKKRQYFSEYFLFTNDFSMVARADETFAFHATVRTEFFPIDWANLREIYCDYMASQYCLLSIGKKIHNWGYVRIFNNEEDFEDVNDRLTTNIVADSINCVSGTMVVPLSFVTLTGMALYNPNKHSEYSKTNPPSFEDISFAGSMEFTFLQTAINFYGRRTAQSEVIRDKDDVIIGITNVVGAEIKRTFFNFDWYAQDTCQLKGLKNKPASNIVTAGFYRLWEDFGLNAEGQYVYDIDTKSSVYRICLDMGIRRVGPRRNLKLGIQWRHDSSFVKNWNEINEKKKNSGEKCWIKIGLIKSNILPHCDWKNGIELFYDTASRPYFYQVRLASIIHLKVDY